MRLEHFLIFLAVLFIIFQFHKGAIRTIYDAAVPGLKAHFNSIKVRLEQAVGYLLNAAILVFQFHKGAIRTDSQYISTELLLNFNSIKVRLEHSSLSE